MSGLSNEFMKPYTQRKCPDSIPAPVWAAFGRCAEDFTPEKWLDYLAVHHLYYDESNTLRPEPLQPTLF